MQNVINKRRDNNNAVKMIGKGVWYKRKGEDKYRSEDGDEKVICVTVTNFFKNIEKCSL